jgi:hypothetical protein
MPCGPDALSFSSYEIVYSNSSIFMSCSPQFPLSITFGRSGKSIGFGSGYLL